MSTLASRNVDHVETVPRVAKPPRGNILFVSNICPKVITLQTQMRYQEIKEGLYSLFSIHGPIYDITIKTKEASNHFAFVDFPNINDAQKALIASKEQVKILKGRPLLVNYCEDPKKNEDRKGYVAANLGKNVLFVTHLGTRRSTAL